MSDNPYLPDLEDRIDLGISHARKSELVDLVHEVGWRLNEAGTLLSEIEELLNRSCTHD